MPGIGSHSILFSHSMLLGCESSHGTLVLPCAGVDLFWFGSVFKLITIMSFLDSFTL